MTRIAKTNGAVAHLTGEVMERIPILRMGNFLLVTIQVDMHDKLALHCRMI